MYAGRSAGLLTGGYWSGVSGRRYCEYSILPPPTRFLRGEGGCMEFMLGEGAVVEDGGE